MLLRKQIWLGNAKTPGAVFWDFSTHSAIFLKKRNNVDLDSIGRSSGKGAALGTVALLSVGYGGSKFAENSFMNSIINLKALSGFELVTIIVLALLSIYSGNHFLYGRKSVVKQSLSLEDAVYALNSTKGMTVIGRSLHHKDVKILGILALLLSPFTIWMMATNSLVKDNSAFASLLGVAGAFFMFALLFDWAFFHAYSITRYTFDGIDKGHE